MYVENPFSPGCYVIVINDTFPITATTSPKVEVGKLATVHPKKGDVLCVDEILGEYLRFGEYDCNDQSDPEYGWRWWKHTCFAPICEEDVEAYYEAVAIGCISRLGLSVKENKPFTISSPEQAAM